jgi:eukaryotic-like serine/threonine-protein kinase
MTLPACETCGAARTAESSAGGLCAACLLAVALTEPSPTAVTGGDGLDMLPAGTTLGQFVIRRLLGRGGMGAVYEAHDTRLDRAVALKILPAEFLHDRTFGRRFEAEARVIARLEHPNIVPIYASGIDSGVPWMSMRLLTGDSLSVLLDRGPLAPVQAVQLLRNVAAALDYAHGLGVVHRDVKPANILLDRSGTACVADFGLAQMSGLTSGLTQTGMITGTPHYMAPEQALGLAFDYRCDIYSLGIVAYELLVGTPPFSGPSPVAVLLQHAHEPLPPPPGPPSSSVWMDAIRKAAAKDPADRWSSADAFVEALARSIDPGATHAGANVATPARSLQLSRHPRGGIAAGALVAMTGLAWAFLHQARTPPPTNPVSQATESRAAAAPAPPNSAPAVNNAAADQKKTGSGLSNRVSRGQPAGRQAAAGSEGAPSSPPSLPGTRTEAPEDVPAPTPTAHVGSAVAVEQLTQAPGVPAPQPQIADVFTEPEIIRKVDPAYPQAALVADVQGDVILEGLVGVDGRVSEITVVRSAHRTLAAAARKAWSEFQYKPARRNGTPEPYRLRKTFRFKPE